jgi:cytochrome c-type biogenesis protein CcmI
VAIWLAAILLIAAVALFIAAPLSDNVLGGRSAASNAELKRREHEHALAVQALRDLEFDHAMGKLDARDYQVLRERLEIRALAAMGEVEKTHCEPPQDHIAPIAAWSQSSAAAQAAIVNFCPQCGTRIGAAHNFCANCGAALAVAATADVK